MVALGNRSTVVIVPLGGHVLRSGTAVGWYDELVTIVVIDSSRDQRIENHKDHWTVIGMWIVVDGFVGAVVVVDGDGWIGDVVFDVVGMMIKNQKEKLN